MGIEELGSYIPTTQVWDIGELQQVDVKSPAFKELLIRLYQNVNNIAQVINDKDTGLYDTSEFVCGQTYFPNPDAVVNGAPDMRRQVYRKVIKFGTLPNAAVKAVAHDIAVNEAYSLTRLYGGATDPVAKIFLPLPYVGAAGANIVLYADDTNIYIDTLAVDYSDYTITNVVIEYLKQ